MDGLVLCILWILGLYFNTDYGLLCWVIKNRHVMTFIKVCATFIIPYNTMQIPHFLCYKYSHSPVRTGKAGQRNENIQHNNQTWCQNSQRRMLPNDKDNSSFLSLIPLFSWAFLVPFTFVSHNRTGVDECTFVQSTCSLPVVGSSPPQAVQSLA